MEGVVFHRMCGWAAHQKMRAEESYHSISSVILPSLGASSDRRVKLRSFILSPCSEGYRAWEIFLIVLVFYSAWVLPFEFSFLQKPCGTLVIADNIVNGIFAIDIILTFFVAYLDGATYLLIDNPKQIAWKYITSWFPLDFASTIPADAANKFLPRITPYGFFNILRLWRLRRVTALFARLEKDRNFNYFWVRSGKLIFVTLFSLHCAGCFYYVLAATYPEPNKTWLGDFMPDFHDRSLWIQYVASIYWAITTLATVGYGDLHPVNTRERIFDIFHMIFNLGLYAYLVGNITSLVVQGTSRTRKYRDTIQAVTAFSCRNRLPVGLHDQMLAHMHLKFRIDSEGIQQQEILEALPKAIRSSISHYLFDPLVLNSYLFRGVSSNLLFQLVSEMNAEYYTPREDVILQNEAPTDFYLLVTGTMELIDYKNGKEQVVQEAKAGDLVGEIGVLCYRPQLFTVRTKKLCQLLRLNRTSFLRMVQLNVGDGTIIMDNLFQYLKEQQDPEMARVLRETEKMLANGHLDVPLTLCFSVIRGDYHLLQQLLRRGFDPNESDINCRTALHIAASKGSESCVMLLLDYGADPNHRDSEGNIPLFAAILGKHKSVIRLLINNGANILSGDLARFACVAAEQNDLEVLKEMAHYGGDVTLPRNDGRTALHLAVCEGNLHMVKFLIELGADVDKVDLFGWTPRSLAEQQGHEEIMHLFEPKNEQDNKSTDNSAPSCLATRPMRQQSIQEVQHEDIAIRGDMSQEKCHMRMTNKFQNSLFGTMSAARVRKSGFPMTIEPSTRHLSRTGDLHYHHQHLHTPLRVTIICLEKADMNLKLVLLPNSLEKLLEIGANFFGFLPKKILTVDGVEVDDIEVIRHGDQLLLVSDDWTGIKGDMQHFGNSFSCCT